MRLTIFAAHHTKPRFAAANSLFVPMWSGGPASRDGSYVVDELVPRKPTLGYNEMSQQYYVWKHKIEHLDYVGFEHYRRVFLFDERFGEASGVVATPEVEPGNWHAFVDDPTYAAIMRRRSQADTAAVKTFADAVADFDIILPLPYTEMSLADQWRVCGQDPAVLDLLDRCIRTSSSYKDQPFEVNLDARRTYFCNLFVCRTSIFDSYMRLWEQVMFALQGSIDMSTRLPSFLSERLFSSFINAKIASDRLRVLELPFCLCEAMKVAHES